MKVLIYEYLSIISPRFECCVHTKKISLNRNGPNTLLYSYHGSDLACFCAFFELKLSTWSHVLIKPSRGALPSSAWRTVLAGIVRMCVVTGLALVTLLLMTTKPGTLGPMWPLTSAHRSREMAQGSVGNSVQCGHCQPASLSASLSNVNSKCVSFETNPTPALEKI